MNRFALSFRLLAGCAAAAALTPSLAQAAGGFGKLTGQVVVKGADADIARLSLPVKIKANDATVKDPQCCAAKDVTNDEIVVNKDNKGVANIFVWVKKVAPADIHPSLKKPASPTVEFDQKACAFKPHCLVVRMDQQVVVKSDDPIQHNTHTYSVFNPGQNFIVGANDRTGIKMPSFSMKERLPFEVKCDIHPWMRAWWLVVDHPYAVVTDADGKFALDMLPEGEHELVVWQERVGYVEKALKVKVENGKAIALPVITVDAAKFDTK